MSTELHVVFGTGPAGQAINRELHARGATYRPAASSKVRQDMLGNLTVGTEKRR